MSGAGAASTPAGGRRLSARRHISGDGIENDVERSGLRDNQGALVLQGVWAVFLVLWFVRPLVRSARGVSSGP